MRIGVDLGGTTMSVGLIDKENQIILKREANTHCAKGANFVIKRMADNIASVMGESKEKISHIGIGCPGMLDRKKGSVLYSNNLGWKNVEIADILGKQFDFPIYLENDANSAAIGEYIEGAGKHYETMVMITLGTGIGGAFILNHRLYQGKHGNANIFGHLVVESNGEHCTCGRRGCWEAYASVTALVKNANQMADIRTDSLLSQFRKSDGMLNGRNIFQAVMYQDKAAVELLDHYVRYMSEGMIDIVNILEPEAIIIGGGISKAGDMFLPQLKKLVSENIYCRKEAMPDILMAKMGNDAGIIGAACLNEF